MKNPAPLCVSLFSVSSVSLVAEATTGANNVWLSTGYGGWDHATLQNEWDRYQSYATAGAVTHSSLLMYGLNSDGSLMSWETGDASWPAKQFQKDLKTKLGLKAVPTLFCDETIGNCKPLATALSKIFQNPQVFIDATISEANQWDWDGFAVDLESFSSLSAKQTDDFLVQWGTALNKIGKELSIWIGGPTQYDVGVLARSTAINSLITMSTYTGSRSAFESIAQSTLSEVGNPSKTGFGLLSSDGLASMLKSMGISHDVVEQKLRSLKASGSQFGSSLGAISRSDMLAISSWAKSKGARHFHIWASEIPANWIDGLKDFIGSQSDVMV